MPFPLSEPSIGPFLRSITVPTGTALESVSETLAETLELVPSDVDGPIQIWVEQASSDHNALLAQHGFTPYRDLWQLRRPLPAKASGIETRSFRPAEDMESFVRVNNRAFSWHPEQGHLTAEEVAETLQQPGFSNDGFRLLELEGQLAGFCWTKIHADEDPPVGEIYVIAIDPDFHGRGLGGPMTLAGLEYLSAQGLAVSNLYVEADNAPALATYDRLGFHHHSTNRAYSNQQDPS